MSASGVYRSSGIASNSVAFSPAEGRVLAACIMIFLLNDVLRMAGLWPDNHGAYYIDYATRLTLIALLSWVLATKAEARGWFGKPRVQVKPLLLSVLIAVVYLVSVVLVFRPLGAIIEPNPSYFWPRISDPALKVFDLTVGLILVAISEEWVFRKLARRWFAHWHYGKTAMVFWSSVLFAAIHWSAGTVPLMTAFFAGALLMMLYLHTNRLRYSVLAHYLINFMIFSGLV